MRRIVNVKLAGFSLLQLSIILTVGALVLASSLPGGAGGSDAEKSRITLDRMKRIEAATQSFMTAYGYRPPLADISAPLSSSTYGLASTTVFAESYTSNGTYSTANRNITGVTSTTNIQVGWTASATNIPDTGLAIITDITTATALKMNLLGGTSGTVSTVFRNPVQAGGVPTRLLGLPDEVAVDGFGRRIVYMLDTRAGNNEACAAMQQSGQRGGVAISLTSTFTGSTSGVKDRVMWALLSYGKDGQGGMSAEGSGSLSSRIKTGDTSDADTLYNAFYKAGTQTPFDSSGRIYGLVQKETTSTFDDLVWYDETTKNTCSLGKSTVNDSLRINNLGGPGPVKLAKGDLNGDGIEDLIIAVPGANGGYPGGTGAITIIFGKPGKGPLWKTANGYGAGTSTTMDLSLPNPTTLLRFQQGMKITNTLGDAANGAGLYFGKAIAVGDFNGDGCDDLAAAGSKKIVVFYGCKSQFTQMSSAFADIDIGASVPAAGNGTLILHDDGGYALATNAKALAMGDFSKDGYDDLLIAADCTGTGCGPEPSRKDIFDPSLKPTTYLVYGTSTSWTGLDLVNTAVFTDAVGFTIATPASGACVSSAYGVDMLDLNADGYSDIILGSSNSCPGGYVYEIFGRNASFFAADNNLSINTDVLASTPATPTTAVLERTDSGGAYLVPQRGGDLMGAGYNNAIFSDGTDIFVHTGSNTGWPLAVSNISFNNAVLTAGVKTRIRLTDSGGTTPSIIDATPPMASGTQNFSIADFNSDGLVDVAAITRDSNPGSPARADAGNTFLMYAPSAGWPAASTLDMFSDSATAAVTNGMRIDGPAANSKLSGMIALDLNGDKRNDMAIVGVTGVSSTPTLWVLYGKSTLNSATATDLVNY